MKYEFRGLTCLFLISPVFASSLAMAGIPVFTGTASKDFNTSDPYTRYSSDATNDVGVPEAFPTGTISGMDMSGAWFYYDVVNDVLYLSLETRIVAGDVDGDGDPGQTSDLLNLIDGTDYPDFGNTESFLITFDTNLDGKSDVVVGKAAVGGSDITDFTAATFNSTKVYDPYNGFQTPLTTNTGTVYASPSTDKPHLEFTLLNVSKLTGMPSSFDRLSQPLKLNFTAYMGSQDDSGFGEDFISGKGSVKAVEFPSPVGSISGFLYRDWNGNGLRDTEDDAMSGVTMTLQGDFNGDGTADQSDTSTGAGNYSYASLRLGVYTVVLNTPFGYRPSLPDEQTTEVNLQEAVRLADFALEPIDTDSDTILDIVEGEFSDTDGDGIPNYLDDDSDNDGADDELEAGEDPMNPQDFDGDGQADYLDNDSDDDGLIDGEEGGTDIDDDGDIDAAEDTDGDGTPDIHDSDSDNDGINDGVEVGITDETHPSGTDESAPSYQADADPSTTTDPDDQDSDDDGIADGEEDANQNGAADNIVGGLPPAPADGSGETDASNPDTDGDGIQDGTESGLTEEDANEDTDLGFFIPDADAGETTTNPLDADTDDGGVIDGEEDKDGDGQVDNGEIDPIYGPDDLDTDGDGLSDTQEVEANTDPYDVDTDDDGINDYDDGIDDHDGDGNVDANDTDSDDDGIADGVEAGLTEDEITPDTEGDFIPDADPDSTTNPDDADSDDDGVLDGDEDTNQDGALDDGETDPNNVDSDGDGLQDGTEQGVTEDQLNDDTNSSVFVPDTDPGTTTDPTDDDSDDDGLLDGSEDANHNGNQDSGETDPNLVDTDGDCIQDGTELGLTEPQGDDTDSSVFVPDADPTTTTNPTSSDSDGGGLPDGGDDGEDRTCDGLQDGNETDPNDPSDDWGQLLGGGGFRSCNSTGGNTATPSVIALAGLLSGWILRRRRSLRRLSGLLPMVGLGLLAGQSAQAQETSGTTSAFELQQYHAIEDVSGSLATTGSNTITPGKFRFGVAANFSNDPLVLVQNGRELYPVIHGTLGLDVLAAYGMAPWLQLGVMVPITGYQWLGPVDPTLPQPGKYAINDVQARIRLRLSDPEKNPIGLALQPIFWLPSGKAENLTGGQFNAGGLLVVDHKIKDAWLGMNVGYRVRPQPASYGATLTVDDEFLYRVGAFAPVQGGHLTLDLFGAMGAQNLFGENATENRQDFGDQPLEVLAGYARRLRSGNTLSFAIGAGLIAGYGSPDYRLLIGFQQGARGGVRDRDGDGIPDEVDKCPDLPEDKDGVDDQDGCPDLEVIAKPVVTDRDGDGIPDTLDKCPDEPEDKDGFEDSDGCPDIDNDQDGILDVNDRCPVSPEDKDGFDDVDGCPEPDNDQDGIPDVNDRCPNDPEDKDGFEDTDGCPEIDNDQDGILDVNDKCINEKEIFNAHEDEDGCPDVKVTTDKVRVVEGKLMLLQKIYFEYDKAVIMPQSYQILNAAITVFKDNPGLRVRIEGHTDSDGSDAYNKDLSQRRADAVRKYLVEKGKIDAGRIESVGYGESAPIETNSTEEGKALNRRIEWVIIE